MRVLTQGHNIYWDISTPEKEEAAFRKLFNNLDENFGMEDFEDDHANIKTKIKQLEEIEILLKDGKFPVLIADKAKELLMDLPMLRWNLAQQVKESALYKMAKGNNVSPMHFLKAVKGRYYADWEIVEIENPLD